MVKGPVARMEPIRRLWRALTRSAMGFGIWLLILLSGVLYHNASWIPPRRSEPIEVAWAHTAGRLDDQLRARELMPLVDALLTEARTRGEAGDGATHELEVLRGSDGSQTLAPMIRRIVAAYWPEARADDPIAVEWGRGVGLAPSDDTLRRMRRELGESEPSQDRLMNERDREGIVLMLQMTESRSGNPDDLAILLATIGVAIVVWWNLRGVEAARAGLRVPTAADPPAWDHTPVWSSTASDSLYQDGLPGFVGTSIVRAGRVALPILGAFLLFDVWVEAVGWIGSGDWSALAKIAVTGIAGWLLARALGAFRTNIRHLVTHLHRSLAERIFPDDYSAGVPRAFVAFLAVAPAAFLLLMPVVIGLMLIFKIPASHTRPSNAAVLALGVARLLLAGYIATVTVVGAMLLLRGARTMALRWRRKKYAQIQSLDPPSTSHPSEVGASTRSHTLRLSVAHLSDLHIVEPGQDGSIPTTAEGHPAGNIGLQKIVRDFGPVLQNADVVAITGDMTDSGAIGEYAALRAMTRAAAGDAVQRKWVVLPGNHDISLPDPKAFTRFEREGFPARRRRLIRAMAFLDEVQGDRAIVSPFADGRHWTLRQYLAANRLLLNAAIEQPNSRAARDVDMLWSSLFPMAVPVALERSEGAHATSGVLLFLFDSNDRASSIITNAFGRVRDENIHRAYALRDGLRKSMPGFAPIYLLHHHVEIPTSILAAMDDLLEATKVRFMKLVNSFAFVSFCAAGPRSVVLHGHRHIAYYGRLYDNAGIPTLDVASARSSTQGNEHVRGDVAAGFDLLQLEVGSAASPLDVSIAGVERMRCALEPVPVPIARPTNIQPRLRLDGVALASGIPLLLLSVGVLQSDFAQITIQVEGTSMLAQFPLSWLGAGIGVLAVVIIALSLMSLVKRGAARS